MKPNQANWHKKHGTFMFPGSTGFNFKFSPSSFKLPRVSSALILGLVAFMSAVAFSPIIAGVFALATVAFQLFFSTNMTILGTGTPTAEDVSKQLKADCEAIITEKLKSIKGLSPEQELEIKSLGEAIKKMSKVDDAVVAKLREDLDEAGLAIKALKENPTPTATKKDSIESQLKAKESELKSMYTKKGESVRLELKAASTITESNVTAVGTGGLSMLLNQFEQGITPIPRSQPFFADLFAAGSTTGDTVSYAEMKNPDGGAGTTAEGAAKSQADFDLVEAKSTVRKITAYIKTSKEALSDIAALASEIKGELLTLVKLKKDSQILSGDNTGQNLNGVLTQATAFTAPTGLALSIPTPNNFDCIVAAITQIMTAEVVSGEPAGFMANYVVMNPIDVANMRLTKSTTGEYVFPITIPGTTSVIEVPVVSNARMTAGSFLVMDSTKGNLRIREDVTLDIGYENDDFTKNLVTILAEMRLTFFIKSNHAKAFVAGTFTDAKSQLQAA